MLAVRVVRMVSKECFEAGRLPWTPNSTARFHEYLDRCSQAHSLPTNLREPGDWASHLSGAATYALVGNDAGRV